MTSGKFLAPRIVSAQAVTLEGKDYVILPREEYETLAARAAGVELPPLPKPDARGNYPAAEYARSVIARDVILDRTKVGLTQRELAARAGIRVETLCRIECGQVTPTVASIEKLDRALKAAEAAQA